MVKFGTLLCLPLKWAPHPWMSQALYSDIQSWNPDRLDIRVFCKFVCGARLRSKSNNKITKMPQLQVIQTSIWELKGRHKRYQCGSPVHKSAWRRLARRPSPVELKNDSPRTETSPNFVGPPLRSPRKQQHQIEYNAFTRSAKEIHTLKGSSMRKTCTSEFWCISMWKSLKSRIFKS